LLGASTLLGTASRQSRPAIAGYRSSVGRVSVSVWCVQKNNWDMARGTRSRSDEAPSGHESGLQIDILRYATPLWTGSSPEVDKYFPAWVFDEERPLIEAAVAPVSNASARRQVWPVTFRSGLGAANESGRAHDRPNRGLPSRSTTLSATQPPAQSGRAPHEVAHRSAHVASFGTTSACASWGAAAKKVRRRRWGRRRPSGDRTRRPLSCRCRTDPVLVACA
jgi:hypothetical protein